MQVIGIVMQCLNVFQQGGSNEFDLNKYSSNISKGCVLEDDLEYSKQL